MSTDLSNFCTAVALLLSLSNSWVWRNKKKKEGNWQCSKRKIWNKLFCWPKGFYCFQQTERKSFTVFLLSTVIQHHAGNEAVLCSRHFCSFLSFIIHSGYKSVKSPLVANNNLLTSFHTLALILSPHSDLGPAMSSKIASAPRCWKCNIFVCGISLEVSGAT